MRKIIGGVTFNTKTADRIGQSSDGSKILYRTKIGGDFFMVQISHADTGPTPKIVPANVVKAEVFKRLMIDALA